MTYDLCESIFVHNENTFKLYKGNESFSTIIDKCKQLITKIINWFRTVFRKVYELYKKLVIKYYQWVYNKENELKELIKELSYGKEEFGVTKVNNYKYDLTKFVTWCNTTKVQFIEHNKLIKLLDLSKSMTSLLDNLSKDSNLLTTIENNTATNTDIVNYLFDNKLIDTTDIPIDVIKALLTKSQNYTYFRTVNVAFKELLETVNLYNSSNLDTDEVISSCKLLIYEMKNIRDTLENFYENTLIELGKLVKLNKYDFDLSSLTGEQIIIFSTILQIIQNISVVIGSIIHKNIISQSRVHSEICRIFIDNIKEINYKKSEVCLSYVRNEIKKILSSNNGVLGKVIDTEICYISSKKISEILDKLDIYDNVGASIRSRLHNSYTPFSITDPIVGPLIIVSEEFISDVNKYGKKEYLDVILYHELGHIYNSDSLKQIIINSKKSYGIDIPMIIPNIKDKLKIERKADAIAVNKFGKDLVIETLKWSCELLVSKGYITKSKSINIINARINQIKNMY